MLGIWGVFKRIGASLGISWGQGLLQRQTNTDPLQSMYKGAPEAPEPRLTRHPQETLSPLETHRAGRPRRVAAPWTASWLRTARPAGESKRASPIPEALGPACGWRPCAYRPAYCLEGAHRMTSAGVTKSRSSHAPSTIAKRSLNWPVCIQFQELVQRTVFPLGVV